MRNCKKYYGIRLGYISSSDVDLTMDSRPSVNANLSMVLRTLFWEWKSWNWTKTITVITSLVYRSLHHLFQSGIIADLIVNPQEESNLSGFYEMRVNLHNRTLLSSARFELRHFDYWEKSDILIGWYRHSLTIAHRQASSDTRNLCTRSSRRISTRTAAHCSWSASRISRSFGRFGSLGISISSFGRCAQSTCFCLSRWVAIDWRWRTEWR